MGHLVLDLAKLVRQRMQLGEGQLRLVDHRVGRIKRRVLRQVADLGPLGDRDDPRVANDLAGEDLEDAWSSPSRWTR